MYRVSETLKNHIHGTHLYTPRMHIIILFTLFDFLTTWSPSYKIKKKAGDMTFLL